MPALENDHERRILGVKVTADTRRPRGIVTRQNNNGWRELANENEHLQRVESMFDRVDCGC